MSEALSPSAQKVQDVLRALGYDHRVIEHKHTTRSAAEAAAAIGCRVEQIAKSLIFKGAESGRPILVIASGANRVDERALEAALGEKPSMADADFVRQQTGFAIGGVPPVGHTHPLTTLIDEDLTRHETVWAAAGTPNAVFQMKPQELVEMTSGQVLVVKPPTD